MSGGTKSTLLGRVGFELYVVNIEYRFWREMIIIYILKSRDKPPVFKMSCVVNKIFITNVVQSEICVMNSLKSGMVKWRRTNASYVCECRI